VPVRLGIVGGGQLAHFLCVAARQLGASSTVLSPEWGCPAARSADRVLVGALDDVNAAAALVGGCDVVTFELEAVDPEVLEYFGGCAAEGRVRVAPGADIMLLLQNKAMQKDWLVRNGHPTSAFEHLPDGPPDPRALVARFGLPLVQKSATGGYDGKGVQIIREEAGLAGLWETPSIVEAFVPDATEVALLVARGLDGATAVYDPVLLDMSGAGNVLEAAVAPAPLPEEVCRRARRLAVDLVCGLDGVGLFAVETFVTPDGTVLVNEISPRVHNAGHHTIEACETSQFAQHVRAVLGLPLGSTRQRVPSAVMRNLLYEPGLAEVCEVGGFDRMDARTATAIHWYGKREGRPRRKMGHVTALGRDAQSARCRADGAVRALSRLGSEVFA